MVAYSFQARFMVPIVERTKRQTIRAAGKRRHARPGEALKLYFGMRTIFCRLIGTATAVRVVPILMVPREGWIEVDGERIHPSQVGLFAVRDGFLGWPEMAAFWAEQHPKSPHFEGVLIEWGYTFTPAPAV